MDLRKKTYSAMFWSLIDQGSGQFIRFIFSLVLARLLLPNHFGLLGMAYVIIDFAVIFVQSGFGAALINNREATKTDECSVFYFNIIIGSVLTAVIFFSAPFIGAFYKNDELVPVVRFLSLNVVLGSFGLIQTALMTKKIDFKAQTKVSLPSTLVSGIIGIGLAYAKFGVWALVIQTLIRTSLHSILLWLVYSWRPCLLFSFKSLRKMFAFGANSLLTLLFQMVSTNIYTILIGKIFNPTQLGYYTRANQTQQLPLEIIWSIIGRISFPVLSIIKNDSCKMRNAIAKASENISFLVFPAMVLGALTASETFPLLFGGVWKPCIPLFQILCIANILYPLENLRGHMYLARGNASLRLKLQVLKNVMVVLSILLSYRFGLSCMLFSFAIVNLINFMVNSYFINKEICYSIKDQIKDLSPYAFCSAVAGSFVHAVSYTPIKNVMFLLSVKIFIGTIVYIGCGYLLKLNALIENVALLRGLMQRRGEHLVNSTESNQ